MSLESLDSLVLRQRHLSYTSTPHHPSLASPHAVTTLVHALICTSATPSIKIICWSVFTKPVQASVNTYLCCLPNRRSHAVCPHNKLYAFIRDIPLAACEPAHPVQKC